jgi:DNA primase
VNDDFRSTLDEIKQRLPIEEVVRWYLPELKRQGALWVACCPFHQEKTPSFKVDPRRGTWHCYGACGTGGDQIAFVERAGRVEFREALEILAARAGVRLPDRRSRQGQAAEDENQPLYEVLARAEQFFARNLRTREGARALEYARSRGLTDATIAEFGLGWAGGGANGLVSRALAQGVPVRVLVAAGLAREGQNGQPTDFFFSRLVFPVRDLKGRTVGFGARRLDDQAGGPKYVNTPQTVLFHKGRLVYGLDRALESVRKSAHLVLVEGYTDVMAAHQAGLLQVAAVLGTATTEDHAALVRRTGARRVSLVFDGDEAGRRATHKALHGLLPLDVTLDVVRLPGNEDPCDVLVRPGGAERFRAELERASGWFDHLAAEAAALTGPAHWEATDRLLELVARLTRPLEREERLDALARRLGVPPEAVRSQLESLPERRREALRRGAVSEPSAPSPSETGQPESAAAAANSARLRRAWSLLVGALLCEPELAPDARALEASCPFADLERVLQVALAEGARSHHDPQVSQAERLQAVMSALGAEPARHLVVPLLEEAGIYENARALFADARRALIERSTLSEIEREKGEPGGDAQSERERLARLYEQLKQIKIVEAEDPALKRDAGGVRALSASWETS